MPRPGHSDWSHHTHWANHAHWTYDSDRANHAYGANRTNPESYAYTDSDSGATEPSEQPQWSEPAKPSQPAPTRA